MTLKKHIENAMLKDGINYESRILDYAVGDLVQIRHTHPLAGKVGRIIGIKVDRKKDRFGYTVKFSDKDSVCVCAKSIIFLHRDNFYETEPCSSDSQVTDSQEEKLSGSVSVPVSDDH